MDGIQSYAGGNRPLVATVHPTAPPTGPVKTASDYVKAVRRRIWLVLIVAIPLATAGTLYVLRMPAVYQVSATIEIKPPRVDPTIAGLISGNDTSRVDATDEKYIPDTLAILKSKSLAEEVVHDQGLGLSPAELQGDPAGELMAKLTYRQYPQSHFYIVNLEGGDPARIARMLSFALHKFSERVDTESRDSSVQAQGKASATLTAYTNELKSIEKTLSEHIRDSASMTPGGRNLKDAEYELLRQRLVYQTQQVAAMQRERQFASARQVPMAAPGAAEKAAQIRDLEGLRKSLTKKVAQAQRIAREPKDPAVVRAKADLAELDDDIAQLKQAGEGEAAQGISPAEVFDQIMADMAGEVQATEGQLGRALEEMKNSMPDYHKYQTLMSDREQKSHQVAALREKLSTFGMLAATQKPPVRIIDDATVPASPKSPNRPMFIAAIVVLSTMMGLGLVCFLEHLDHSVKVPEHLTAGLGLPLFGVVPRMLRNARNNRGGHLWAPGVPESIEADAYRNLRASLLGAQKGPMVTLLVTSAKAGEGKSTTALNLAATCARAGERTLLMDVDLRRPSLNEVFPREDEGTGLVDVLRGDQPWQRTVVQTDLPNLDFLPTGDTRDVPIEVLGSLELRQLLISLSEHHYDRVILDGPAVLGLADCRMLGRIVDGALMVVRAGSLELRPLQRAKSMLEQSRVHIAGLVFNSLSEDLQNWSSYGPNPLSDSSIDFGPPRPSGASRNLDAPHSRAAAALMAAGPVES